MIKRLLIFLILLTAGFVVLFNLVDERSRPKIQPGGPEPETGHSIKMKEIEVRPSGQLHIPVQREVELSKGRMKLLPVYDLRAEDSEPRPNNTQLLKRVRVEFYEIDDTHDADREPRARRTSVMTADRALLHLSQDENGRVMVAEDKQMEFWGVKLTTAPEASVPDAEITIEHAIAVNDIEELRLWTPTDTVPVSVIARGPDGFRIKGLGIRTYLPARRGRKGEVSIQRQGVFRFTIASQPVLVRGSTTLESRGPLEFREDMATGLANVSMQDQVILRGLSTGTRLGRRLGGNDKGTPSSLDLVARGRRLDAVLVRVGQQGSKRDNGSKSSLPDTNTKVAWTRLVLRGTPVQVEGEEMRLSCDRVDVLPDLAGDPCWITASGNRPTLYHERQQARVIATRHIHLIRPLHKHAALLSGYGMPEVAMPRDHGQLIIFEGPATVVADKDQITASARGGLVANRAETGAEDNNAPMTFFGKGKVHLESPQWVVDGNRGFRLREVPLSTGTTSKPAVNRFLRLGLDDTGGSHAYRIERLPSEATTVEPFVTNGTGACHLTLRADGNGSVRLDSGNNDIRVLLGEDRGELQRVASFKARFHDKRGLLALKASGPDCPLRYKMEQVGWVVGNAAEIHVPAAGVLRLVGKPRTRIQQEQPMRIVEGREILVQRLGEKAALVHCSGDARMRMRQQEAPEAPRDRLRDRRLAHGSHQDVELLADDIRMLPYLETPTGWQVHGRGLPPGADSVLAYGHRIPYVFANGSVRLFQRDTDNKVVGRGFGDHLVLRFASSASAARIVDGRLSGMDSRLIRIDRRGNPGIAEARIIRFASDARGEHLDLLKVGDFDPRVTLPSPSPDKRPADRPGATLVTCKGNVRITPEKVRFLGPVVARAMDNNGQVDPNGLYLTACSTVMDRDPRTGEVTTIQASREIRFRMNDMEGEADEMSVDLRRTMIVARGIGRHAVLRQANGRVIKAVQVNHNYRTRQTSSWNGRIVQAARPK